MLFAIISVLGVIFLFFIMLYVMYYIAFGSPHKKQNDYYNLPLGGGFTELGEKTIKLIDTLVKEPFEEIKIKSFDNLTLYGRYYHKKDDAPIILGFHGYRGTSIRDMCGSAEMGRITQSNVLLVDQRAHGESDGKTITFGLKEKYDVLSWVNYLVNRFGEDVKIVLNGVSMGATTVLMATGLDLPSNVKGIIADCPFSSPKKILKKVIGQELKMSVKIFYPLLSLSARIFGGMNVNDGSCVDSVKNAKVPILLIHGESDTFVPCSMSEEISKSSDKIKFVTFPNAEHAMSYMTDKKRYHKEVIEFINKIL